jgi:hypothetical protein
VVAKIGGCAARREGRRHHHRRLHRVPPPKPKKVGSAKQVKTEGDKKIDEAKAELQDLLDAGKKPPAVIGDAL